MLLNCGVGEDSWESLGLQGDPSSPSWRRSVLSFHWKDWCWNSSILATWCADSFEKTLMLGKIEGRRRRGTTEDEMVAWHHRLSGHEFGSTLGDGDGQGGLACCSPWGHKESDTTELNWIELYKAPKGKREQYTQRSQSKSTWGVAEEHSCYDGLEGSTWGEVCWEVRSERKVGARSQRACLLSPLRTSAFRL